MAISATEPRPLDRVLELLPDARSYSNGYLACCPSHGDRSPSLMIWEDEHGHVGLKCFTGCSRKQIVETLGITESDLYLPDGKAPGQKRKTIDLCDLAVDKGIHPNDLTRLGLRDGKCIYTKKKGQPCDAFDIKGVVIPYYDTDGSEYARYRLRAARSGQYKNLWNEDNAKHPIIPYGLHRLKEAYKQKYLIIPEGESDCWTLWLHGFPALGIPGVEMTRVLIKAHLEGIEKLYIIQEPQSESDKENGRDPGKKFVTNLEKRLKEIGYTGRVYTIDFKEETGVKDPNELHQRDIKGFKQAFDTVLLHARPLSTATEEKQRAVGRSLKDLMAKVLPPVKWAVPDIIPEGLNLLCGKPKLGKSWLALHIALAIAYGGVALGNKQVEQGQVLYLALEDNERRMQSRVKQLLQEQSVPDDFDYDIECPRLDQGGYDLLEAWIKTHSRARLIVIDTWVKISPRPQGGRQRTQYEDDYDSLSQIKRLSDRYNVAILAIHHLRKTSSEDDFLDEVSGSVGVAGTVDGIIGLKRERGQFDATLHVTGRDIEDDAALALSFDRDSALWKLIGNAEEVGKTKERQAILNMLKEYPDGLSARELADLLEKNYNTLRNILTRMEKSEELAKDGSKYIIPKSGATVVNRSHRSQQTREPASRASSQKTKVTTVGGVSVVNRSQSSSYENLADYTDDYGDHENDYGSDGIDYGSDYGEKIVDGPVEPVQQNSDYGDYARGKILAMPKSIVKCSTSFDSQMCEAHTSGKTLTMDEVGNVWCEQCDDQRKLMNLGHAQGWPATIFDMHGGKVKLPAGQEKYLKFARTSGHRLVSAAVAKLEAMKDTK